MSNNAKKYGWTYDKEQDKFVPNKAYLEFVEEMKKSNSLFAPFFAELAEEKDDDLA